MAHSILAADQTACIRASLLHDGAGLSLEVVAGMLACPVEEAARRIALGRLMAIDGLAVIPRRCTPHLAGFVLPTGETAGHFQGCPHCQHLAEAMSAGIRLAQTTYEHKALHAPGDDGAPAEVPSPPPGEPAREMTPAPPPPPSPLQYAPERPADPRPTARPIRPPRSTPAAHVPQRHVLRSALVVLVVGLVAGWMASPAARSSTLPVSAQSPPLTKSIGIDEARVGDPYYTGTWDRLADCMSGGDWVADGGGLVISPESWTLVGGPGLPNSVDRSEQISRAIALWELQGWSAWPGCADVLGWH